MAIKIIFVGHGEVRVYLGTGVSRRVRRTTWESSLKNWEFQIPCFEEFFWGGNTLGLVPASLPHALGYACTFYAPTSPPPILRGRVKRGISRGFEKRANRGRTLKFYCWPKAQEKEHFGKSHFYCRRFFPGNTVTIILDNYPPSTLQGSDQGAVRIRELLSERILVISAPPGEIKMSGHPGFGMSLARSWLN